jgi:prepilin-type N-terminal cleavage/methylation domain-containing protein
MKKGFTLLELMVVIIILGVLATLGVMQYQSAIEKSRGAEARQVIGQLRTQCAAIYMQDPTGDGTDDCTNADLGIGNDIPGPALIDCQGTHFFAYASTPAGPDDINFQALRCEAGNPGKSPSVPAASGFTLDLDTNFATGADDWSTNAGY